MPAPSPTTEPSTRPAILSPQWWVRDRSGRLAIAQAPNAAILVWVTSVVVGWFDVLDDHRSGVLTRVGQGALIVWALDEVLRGASPFRRVLGLVVLAAMLVRVFG